ncbi:MAG TPA: Gfo/Idh/MocA family oxidoreductase [Longimicrobiales bacterium]|nr:Gfo/Idh/MocA family oxidoreductase [Longimicrobiales bacterium]
MSNRVGVAVIGCGLVGAHRARTAAADPRTALRIVIDTRPQQAARLAAEHGVDASSDWRVALARDDVGAVVICTPNALLVPIGVAALRSGRHVLIEKPMGRNVTEGRALAAEARRSGAVLKVGFRHRYRESMIRARELLRAGAIGRLIQLRARYGYGARPEHEKEWRADAELAGGGALLDEGVHIVDLFHWFAGAAQRAQAELQTAVWDLGRLEDNAFAMLRFAGGVVGQFHVGTTEWKNLFSFEIRGDAGGIHVEGLGGSYGQESLVLTRRAQPGAETGIERSEFTDNDSSWAREWADFAAALHGARLHHGTADEGLQVLATVDALYAAARSGSAISIAPAPSAPRDISAR